MSRVGSSPLHVVLLAAGKGTRMKSARPKVLHTLAGRALVDHVLRSVEPLGAVSKVLVVGHGADEVRAALADRSDLEFVLQSPQLGTGHALLQAEPVLRGLTGTVLLVYADVPLLQSSTLSRLVATHLSAGAAATVLTTEVENPFGYGRMVRDASGRVARIVEERDATPEERAVKEINSGIYAFDLAPLFDAVRQLGTNNAQGEYYLTDLVAAYRGQNRVVETMRLDDAEELRGVNSRVDLADLTQVMRHRKNRELMLAGVTLEDPATTSVDMDVTIGPDTVLGPFVRIERRTTIGERCHIHAGSRLTEATVADDVTVLDYSVVVSSTLGRGARVGPFSHIRPDSSVGEEGHVGNFVELKKTRLGRRSKANHLAYLGDATIGDHVNVGAGTITCNYDGEKKQPTVVEDGVFIGSDSQLIAPVVIGHGAYVAAGSSITGDVPPDALAISRGRQENKLGWASKRRSRSSKGD
jgi:bifunctional UDP-N-acetylglucosamine pyrophosphorylase/glucosamine-1-phosphate N-acetyltransferase